MKRSKVWFGTGLWILAVFPAKLSAAARVVAGDLWSSSADQVPKA
jgi:hypothetical protein